MKKTPQNYHNDSSLCVVGVVGVNVSRSRGDGILDTPGQPEKRGIPRNRCTASRDTDSVFTDTLSRDRYWHNVRHWQLLTLTDSLLPHYVRCTSCTSCTLCTSRDQAPIQDCSVCIRHSCNNVDQWLNPLARFSDRKELAVDQGFKVRVKAEQLKSWRLLAMSDLGFGDI